MGTAGLTAAVLAAAGLHAAWNALAYAPSAGSARRAHSACPPGSACAAHEPAQQALADPVARAPADARQRQHDTPGVPDTLASFVVINLAAAGCAAVLVCLAPSPLPACWPFLLVSAVVQAGYQVALLQAYRLGDFGQMYPIARGTSPWLVTIVATVLLGQPMPAVELAGVLVISGGLGALALAGGVPDRSRLPEFAAALGTGVLISAYTVVDGLGVRHSGTPSGYVAWLFLLHSPVLPLLALATRGRALLPRLRPVRVRGLTGGVLSLSAYGIVIWAQSRGALASVAALRETSIVIGALIGALLFRERFGPVRIVASAVVVAGIVLLNLG